MVSDDSGNPEILLFPCSSLCFGILALFIFILVCIGSVKLHSPQCTTSSFYTCLSCFSLLGQGVVSMFWDYLWFLICFFFGTAESLAHSCV